MGSNLSVVLEKIKKTIERVYVGDWYISGVKTNGLSVIHNAADSSMFGITAETYEAEYIAAANPFAVSRIIIEIETLHSVLAECQSYFEARADADSDQDGFIPNEEMRIMVEIRDALNKIR